MGDTNAKAAAVVFAPYEGGAYCCLMSPYSAEFVGCIREQVAGIWFQFDKRLWYAPMEEKDNLVAAAAEYWDVLDLTKAKGGSLGEIYRSNGVYKEGYEAGRKDGEAGATVTLKALREQVRRLTEKNQAEYERGRMAGRRQGAPAFGGTGGFGSSAPNSPFRILHVEEGAPKEVCEAAYKALVRKFHPDVAGPSGHDKTVALNRAMDELKRRWP